MTQPSLFSPFECSAVDVAHILAEHHYLGAIGRGIAWKDEAGVLVFVNPSSRNLPPHWFELARWCITSDERNAGSRQWARVAEHLKTHCPNVSTVVSYSDPSRGHSGSLYRACGWLWAPTWHRLRPPPSGAGSWDGEIQQCVKDRWVYLLSPDPDRQAILSISDESLAKRMPWVSYSEPEWKRGRYDVEQTRFKRWKGGE